MRIDKMINSRQRAQLRGMANQLDVIVHVGKGGISDNLVTQVNDALEARELIKLRVLDNSGYTSREAAEEIAEIVSAEVIQTVGTRFVLYRESKKNKKIELI